MILKRPTLGGLALGFYERESNQKAYSVMFRFVSALSASLLKRLRQAGRLVINPEASLCCLDENGHKQES